MTRHRTGSSCTGTLLAAAAIVLGVAKSSVASVFNAGQVGAAAAGFLSPDCCREVQFVYPARGKTVWLVGVDWGFPVDPYRAPAWFARRVGGDGRRIGDDIELTRHPTLEKLSYVAPLGEAPDGSLVVFCEVNPFGWYSVAKIGPRGVLGVSEDIGDVDTRWALVDKEGLVHMMLLQGSLEGVVDYIQMDAKSNDLPILRRLDYQKPFGESTSAPSYLRWGGAYGARNGIAFCDEGGGRLVVAARRSWNDSVFSVCRVNTKTLALLDSGHIHLTRDAFQSWNGPVIHRSVLAPAGETGYWLFTPAPDTQKLATVLAYRLRPDLKVVRPAAVVQCVAGPFASAPPDAVTLIYCSSKSRARWGDGVWLVPSTLEVDFLAFGGDGRLYTQAFEDSLTSRVTK